MNEQTMRFRLGIFVLGACILLAILTTLFGGLPNFFKQYNRYTVVLNDAAGVASGTPVRRSGVRIGEVEKVRLDDSSGKVFVEIKVEPEHIIRKNDQPKASRNLMGGDVSIDFVTARPRPGEEPDLAPVEPGAILVGTLQSDPGDLLQQVSQITPQAQDTLKEMEKVLKRLDKMAPLVEETLKEYRDLARVGREAVPAMREAAEQVRELAKVSRETVPDLRRTNDEIRELAKATRDTIPELKRTNEEVQLTARYWGKLGERLNVLVQTNEDKLVKTLDQLNQALKGVTTIFNDENQKNLAETLRNVRNGTANLEGISRSTEGLIKDSRETVKRVNDSLTRTDEVLTNLQQATKPLAERSQSLMKNLDEASYKLNQMLTGLTGLTGGLSGGNGTLQRLLSDPSLYQHLDEAACMITRSVPRLDRILRDMETFADRIARHPEALGLGGALRPASGLKEAPSTWNKQAGH